jgi:hypothetical protein
MSFFNYRIFTYTIHGSHVQQNVQYTPLIIHKFTANPVWLNQFLSFLTSPVHGFIVESVPASPIQKVFREAEHAG